MSRFGRTVAHQVLDAVDARMDSQPTPGLEMILAGQPVDWPDGSEESQPVAEQVVEQLAQWVSISSDGATGAVPSLQENDLLANSSFAFGSQASGNGGLFSFWDRGAVSNFDGKGRGFDPGRAGEYLDAGNRLELGSVARRWRGQTLYRRADGVPQQQRRQLRQPGYQQWLRGRGRHSHRSVPLGAPSLHGTAGGLGSSRLRSRGVGSHPQADLGSRTGQLLPTTDLNLWLAAAGLRGTLLDGDNHGITLTGKTDVMAVGTSSAQVTGANGNLAAAEATVTRLRLGLEAQRPFSFGDPEADSQGNAYPFPGVGSPP